jgi:hypothetical protein
MAGNKKPALGGFFRGFRVVSALPENFIWCRGRNRTVRYRFSHCWLYRFVGFFDVPKKNPKKKSTPLSAANYARPLPAKAKSISHGLIF